MTNSSTQLDLSQLQRKPAASPSSHRIRVRRHWVTRYVIPFVIVGGFLGLLVVTAGKHFLPLHSVTVLPVLVSQSETTPAGSPLFKSAGWVEPRPQAVGVAALAAGVVDELLVVEGQFVDRGEPIAKLFTQDAELVVRQAKANLALRQGEVARCEAELRAANARISKPIHLEVLLADAKGQLAKSKTELASLPFHVEAARSKEAFARKNWDGKQAAQGGIAERVIQQAESEFVSAKSSLQELIQRQPHLQNEVDALDQKVVSIEIQLTMLIDEKRQLDEAKAKFYSATAIVDEAKVQVEQAELSLSRMLITAPLRGRILRVMVSRGTRVMGLETNAGQNTSTIALMYDPSQLQVRADVRLEDVPKIQNGQPVEIHTASVSKKIQGRVLQATSSANVQKNTLEVKVALIDPPSDVCPEMLVTATFLSMDASTEATTSSPSKLIRIPISLTEASDMGAFVWTVDEWQRAIRKPVVLGNSTSNELIEVISGLNPTDKLIVQGREALTPGESLRIIGEDKTMGQK